MEKKLIPVIFLMVTINLVSGCAETKTNQCREIFRIANGTIAEARNLTQGGKSTDPEAALLAADTMELAAEEMSNLEITDEGLKGYQKQFIQMYQQMAIATRKFVQAYEETNKAQLKQAKMQLKEATAPEQELVKKINEYCLPEN